MTARSLRYLAAATLLFAGAALAQDEAPAPPKPTTEAGWIAHIENNEAFEARQEACRALHQVGTEASVPVLARLLEDKELSSWARFALEQIPSETVDDVLLDALEKTTPELQAGIVTSLGVRKVSAAVPALTGLLGNDDASVSEASAGALGRIGSDAAVDALLAVEAAPDSNLGVAVAEALLAAAEARLASGDNDGAVALYSKLRDGGQTQPVQLGALRGLAHADSARASELIVDALESGNRDIRNFAAQLVAETSGEGGTAAFAEVLPTLSPSGQAALIRGLATRGDLGAHPAIAAAVNHPDANVKTAAVEALGKIGRAADVVTLAGLLTHENETVARAAAQSLRQFEGDDIDDTIALATEKSQTPGTQAALLGILSDRLTQHAVPLAVRSLGDNAKEVRLAALNTIVRMGTEAEFGATTAALRAAQDKEERNLAGKALAVLCKRGGNALLPNLAEALTGAAPEAQAVAVRCFDDIGTPEALTALVALQQADSPQVRDAAVDVLSSWPTQDAAPHLLALAESDNEDYQDAGFDGYVRLAREAGDANLKADMLETAMPLARRAQQRWRVLAVWGTVHTPRALGAVRPYLADQEVRNEAGAAVITIAEQLAKNPDHKDAVVAALEEVAANARNMVKERADAMLADLRKAEEDAQASS